MELAIALYKVLTVSDDETWFMTVLITGATGLIGRALAESCLQDRISVRALARDPAAVSTSFGNSIEGYKWDPLSDPLPPAALDGVTTVFHLMGESVGGRWTKEKRANIIASRVTAAQKLADAVRGQNCRFISASSFGIYPGSHGAVYSETEALAPPATEIQTILQNWEAAALSAASENTNVNVMRFGMVCAPDGYPKKLVRLFKRGLSFVAGNGNQIVPIVSLSDAVGMLRWAASGNAGDGVINCVSPQLPTFRDVARIIADCLSKPVRFNVPEWLARPALGGSADYFLLSYHLRPQRALERGYNFRMSDPEQILRSAILGKAGTSARS